MKQLRELVFYEHYFEDFFNKRSEKVKEKIDYVLFLVTHSGQVPQKFLKHLQGIDGLYEIRVEVSSNIYRIFCCFDKGRLIILFNGFQKKTQRTPVKQIETAKKLMNEYFKK